MMLPQGSTIREVRVLSLGEGKGGRRGRGGRKEERGGRREEGGGRRGTYVSVQRESGGRSSSLRPSAGYSHLWPLKDQVPAMHQTSAYCHVSIVLFPGSIPLPLKKESGYETSVPRPSLFLLFSIR